MCIPSTYFSVYTKHTFQCVYQAYISVCIPSKYFGVYTKHIYKCVYQIYTSLCIPSKHFSEYTKHKFQCVHQAHISVRIPSTHLKPNFKEWVNYCSIMKVFKIAHDTSSVNHHVVTHNTNMYTVHVK